MHITNLFTINLITSILFTVYSQDIQYIIDYVNNAIPNTVYSFQDQYQNTNLTTDSIRFYSPQCTKAPQDPTKEDIVKFTSCNVFALMNFTITTAPNYTFALNNFYYDLYYDEINYQKHSNRTITPYVKISINDHFVNPAFNYNSFRAPISSLFFENLTLMLNTTGYYLRDKYSLIIADIYINKQAKTQLESDLQSAFTLLYLDSTVYKNKGKRVTYYSFYYPTLMYIINLKEITFIQYLSIQFEYSIDYNITYQSGGFLIEDFVFEKSLMNNDAAFDGYTYKNFIPDKEEKEIKDYMFTMFKTWLISSIKKLYLQKDIEKTLAWDTDTDFDT